MRHIALTMTTLCFMPFFSHAAELSSCTQLVDTYQADSLRLTLDHSGLPHYIKGRTICVEEKHRKDFLLIINRTIPDAVNKGWVYLPKVPDGKSLNYLMPINRPMHEALKYELSKRGIWFTTDQEDILWFETTNRAKVLDIIFGISEGTIKVR